MFKYAVQRILYMLLVLLIITAICFTLIRLLPPEELPPNDIHTVVVEARREAAGYNKPIPVQFGIFLRDVVTRFDWGVSDKLYFGQEVADIFMDKLPASMVVNFYSIILSIPFGIALGIFAALKKNTWIDYTISTATRVVISVPSFVYAFLIQYVLCFKLGWFPLTMSTSDDYFTWEVFRSMLPAVFALCLGSIAGYARYTRAELSEVLTGEFMLLARTKGLTKSQAIYRHAMRNSMVVIFPSILSEFISVLSGSLIIEKMFGINGVGGLYLNSITFQDYDFFMLLSGFYTLVSLTAGIVIDISYGFIDPRIRMGAK